MITSNSQVIFSSTKVVLSKNKAQLKRNEDPGSLVAIESSRVTFENSYVVFKGNQGQNCGGITAADTVLAFVNSTVDFIDNKGKFGGAMSLNSGSLLTDNGVQHNSTLTFVQNNATIKGGAVFVDDISNLYVYRNELRENVFQLASNVHFKFSDNRARIGGDNIYGGWVDWTLNTDYQYALTHTLRWSPKILSNNFDFNGENPGITSNPTRICMCGTYYGGVNCNVTDPELSIYPGETISIILVAVGQNYGTVETLVKASVIEDDLLNSTGNSGTINEGQTFQRVKRTCTSLNYTIYSQNKEEIILFSSWPGVNSFFSSEVLKQYSQLRLLFEQLSVTVKLKDCPLGFSLDRTEQQCVCSSKLELLGLSCNLDVFSIKRNEQQWIGIAYEHITANETFDVIAHQHCPFDYCRSDQDSLLIHLEQQDEQCAFNRSGVLCGGCQVNFSRVLGSSKCKQCSTIMLLPVIIGILLAGLLLVVLLMLLNLTVSVGTINGLIFYANVVQLQRTVFFTPESTKSFLGVFIAWLNFDLGIETCLYNGLDSYAETWLQFCFPLYIWILAAIIIISSHYSIRISKLCGKNAVQVLATLFLLSYTKILQVGISVVAYYTTITFPDGYTKPVWLRDGNIDFLKGKHIPLFLATLLFLIFFTIPYTIALLGVRLLLKVEVPNYRIKMLIRGLMPFFRAYAEPYKDSCIYWTGLLLIVRVILLITLSVRREHSVNIFVIVMVSATLQAWLYFTRWVYKDLLNNLLEMAFLANLGLSSTVMLYMVSSGAQPPVAVTYTSTGIAFVLFVGIIFYHVLKKLFLTKAGEELKRRFLPSKKTQEGEETLESVIDSASRVTYSLVELNQPLL